MIRITKLKGISLIVLVITIIVMIILAGAIIISLTNGNVIAKAKFAKESNDCINIREMVDLEKYNMLLNSSATISGVTIPDAYADDIMVSNIGGIFLKPNSDTKISDIGNALDKLGAAYMPIGFEHVIGTLDEGIVIKNTADGNEFVWIPVPDIEKFYLVDGTDFLLFNEYIGTGYKSYNTASTTETAEYNAMVASVEKYKGFYIARYEAGKPTGTGLTGGTTTGLDIDGTDKPISKANETVWNNIKWDAAYTSGLGDDTHNGAVKVSRSMYPVLSATTVGMPISTLIYGEQWDAAMRYMKDVSNITNISNKYIVDSTDMGVYGASAPTVTGSNTAYKVKNIYDMAGNVSEFTMEACNTSNRVICGGTYNSVGSTNPASNRLSFMPINISSSSFGFRTAMYIK